MYLRRIYISTILLACFMLTAPWSSALAQDEQKSNNRNSQSLSASSSSSSSFGAGGSSPNNDIYIDDEGLEGSGSRGEIRDDLEKEDDESSGSGYGDDDEDSSSRGSSRSSVTNVGIGGGSKGISESGSSAGGAGGAGGSGDHGLDGGEDDEDDDLYTETKRPSIDLGPTDDEDMVPIDTGKSGGSVTHGHVPEGSDPDTHTPRIPPTEGGHDSNNPYSGSGVLIMNAKNEDRTASFFAQPGILAAVIGGAVVGLLCAILVVMFIVYRMRKKDEGSYALDEPKRSPTANTYAKNANNREFYA